MDPFTLAALASAGSGLLNLFQEPGEFRKGIRALNREKSRIREMQRLANIDESGAQVASGIAGGGLASSRRKLMNQPYESAVAEIKRKKRKARKSRLAGLLGKSAGIGADIFAGIDRMTAPKPAMSFEELSRIVG